MKCHRCIAALAATVYRYCQQDPAIRKEIFTFFNGTAIITGSSQIMGFKSYITFLAISCTVENQIRYRACIITIEISCA